MPDLESKEFTMSSILQEFVQALKSRKVEIIDMSHTLQPATPVIQLPEPFNQTLPFRIEEISNFDERGPNWYWNNIHLGEHTGTHFDAPIHWITGRDYPDGSVDKIPAEKLIAPAIVIDVTAKVDADDEYLMTLDDVKEWEDEHGMIPEGAWVLVRTGWQSRYPTEKFLDNSRWPGQHPDVPGFLAHERKVIGVGTEPVGTDAGAAHSFETRWPCHHHMHGTNRYGLSSLANMDKLPATGAVLITPPLKIIKGSGSPCRVLALVER
ncbi:cyclase family protein [Sphingobium sp. LMA1-1-1.1]|uniref:cyclase family protein n=1 Tax=unclassified Sphingobium TaxID=2611147 RepID=UPI0034340697